MKVDIHIFPQKALGFTFQPYVFFVVTDAHLRLQKNRIGTLVIARSFEIEVMTILRDNMLSGPRLPLFLGSCLYKPES